ncbi:MAG: right-handed parallel beta-helix repeat-containing protein, partial [Rhodospirillaceae bacterium]|nr:right-handed parallel beta-helix repeat-containing protein [Rhodospirillaceae bacterium]
MPISNRSVFAAVLAACFGLAVSATLADVEVWTDKERVILKGDLKGMRVLPPGSKGKARPTGAKRPKAKPRVANRAPRTLRVGPGEEFKLPSQAAAFAVDGDTIEIKAGEYVDCATWRRNNLTIRGVGGRAHVKDKVCSGKGIWNLVGKNTTIENIEFSGMYNASRNGSGIRHQGMHLTVRNSYFHDGEEGILGGYKAGNVILVEDSLFERLGAIGQSHPIYINGGKSMTLRRTVIRGCIDQANCFKSRAQQNTLTCNVIASMDGNSSWEVDIPYGGRATIRNNVIQQGARSVNYGIIGFAMETHKPGQKNPEQTLNLENNLIINDHNKGRFIVYREHKNTKFNVRGNKFVGKGRLDHRTGNKLFRD